MISDTEPGVPDATGNHGYGTFMDLPPVAAVLASDQHEALAAARRHAHDRGELLIVAESRADEELKEQLLSDGFAVLHHSVVTQPEYEREPQGGRIWLLTSGTTGRPKRVGHTLESLTTVRPSGAHRRWLCPYSPGTYAWWQMVTLCLGRPDQQLIPVEEGELEQWPQVLIRSQATAASGTPTFWRHGLLRARPLLQEAQLEQVTVGGEPVDQLLLDDLRSTFPAARVTWIYASSEAGAAIVVHDGISGFPVEWLDRRDSKRPHLAIINDELVISSPFHGEGLEGAIRTGDRVEVWDGRVHILGRIDTEEVNVGGSKFPLSRLKEVLLQHPGVQWANVRSRRAPVVGQVLVADLVVGPPTSERDIIAWCEARVPEYAVPRRLRFLDAIPLQGTLKSHV